MEAALWKRVGELADRAPTIADLRHHRLQLIASSRMRARGETPPATLRADERRYAAAHVTAPVLLRRIRSLCDGRLVLMKGPELATRWPQARQRPSGDIDLLADDAPAAHAALVSAGFVMLGDPNAYVGLHHLVPLALRGMPLTIEIHSRPHWPAGFVPGIDEIAEAATPSALGIDGLLAPRPAHHAVLLAVHAWEHEPLGRVGSLADVAAMTEEADPVAVSAVARTWGVSRIWNTTARAVDELLSDAWRPVYWPIWKRHLRDARERTVFEHQVAQFSGPVATAPPAHAPVVALHVLDRTLRRANDESWSAKLRRSLRAARNASAPRSWHEAKLTEQP